MIYPKAGRVLRRRQDMLHSRQHSKQTVFFLYNWEKINQAFYKSPAGLVFYTVILEPVFYINTEILPKNFLKLGSSVDFIAVLYATAEVKF